MPEQMTNIQFPLNRYTGELRGGSGKENLLERGDYCRNRHLQLFAGIIDPGIFELE